MNTSRNSILVSITTFLLLACSGGGGGGGTSAPAPTITGVSLTPTSPSLLPNGTQTFSALVSGTGSFNPAVQWSSPAGSFSNATANPTTFTAPATGGTYTVTVTSTQDPTKSASAVVTVSAVTGVLVSPSTAALPVGGMQTFSATVLGTGPFSPSVVWSTSGGSITTSGLYTAPAAAGTYTVTATSVHDGTKSGSATVTVSVPSTITSVVVSPATATLSLGGTQQFAATVSGTGNYSTAVAWSATGGTVTAGGLYTAPNAAGTYTLTATSVHDGTKSGSATVTVSVPSTITSVVVSPALATLSVGATQQFAAAVSGTGNYSTAVDWYTTGGSITASGLYTAPNAAGTYSITALSMQDGSKAGTATVTVTNAGSLVLLAGAISGRGSVDGQGSAARFFSPGEIARDSAGNVYVADLESFTIRTISPSGVVSTLAGTAGQSGYTDGQGPAARFSRWLGGLAVDSAGNVYVSDDDAVRKITPSGNVTTFAGAIDSGSIDGQGTAARFNFPRGMAMDSAGTLYVADSWNRTIRKISPTGYVSTLAGSPGQVGSVDGQGSAARFSDPDGVAVDAAGNLIVADTGNHTIRKITPSGLVSTLAGAAGLEGSTDGPAAVARFSYPHGVAVDSAGNIFVSENNYELGNHTIRKITPAGIVSTLAGVAGSTGAVNGQGSAARFYTPLGLCVDGAGNVLVADAWNDVIRKVSPSGVVTTYAGLLGAWGGLDGQGSAALFHYPRGLAMDGAGNAYLADSYNHAIRKITPSGQVSTLAGTLGQPGALDGQGPAARFKYPHDVAVDVAGNVYVADSNNHTIRKITPNGVTTTLAGLPGQTGVVDGLGGAARFNFPRGIAVDGSGTVFVADYYGHTIRKITPTGMVSTLAGSAGDIGSSDGQGTAARFRYPYGLAVDGAGNVYVVDSNNHTIRKITPSGMVSTLAGLAGVTGSADGQGPAARFNGPWFITLGSSGNLYVSDAYNGTIRKVTPSGMVTTVVGVAGQQGTFPGALPALLAQPRGVAVGPSGELTITVLHALLVATPGSGTFSIRPNPGTTVSLETTPAASEASPPAESRQPQRLRPMRSEGQPERAPAPPRSPEVPPGSAQE